MENYTAYKNQWIADKLERINLTVAKGDKELIRVHAAGKKESVNAFINRAIKEQIERDNAEG